MDFINKLAEQASGKQNDQQSQQQQQQQQQQQDKPSGSFLDKLHGMAGGGPESEKKEDALDKGIDWVQEHVLKQGNQDNESVAEQAKDKMIAKAIRDQYEKATGKPFPIKEKEEEKKSSGLGGLFSS
ncbi:hypothetical protein VTK26DRAFT_9309 [Humicola hyalothermophila]